MSSAQRASSKLSASSSGRAQKSLRWTAPVEYRDRHVRVAGELVAQERKIEQVLARVGVDRVDYAYGDTWMDIPLLEHAEHPVAVYPDARLRSTAQERGWEIMGDRVTSY